MPGSDIKTVLGTKPVTFTLKTGSGKWKCTLHSDRPSYEKYRSQSGLVRSDSGLSMSSVESSSAGSTTSH
ncbi:hypothetical protein BX600DRAFT_504886 [Xylariales sp. PMI_506]|nr:hypothetical protein BX600DRAFT_504886 [Xylariales sp. PMI_506]